MWVYLAIVVTFCFLYPLIPRKHIKWLFVALVLALSVMAFFVEPYSTDDLAKYFRKLETLRPEGWGRFFERVEEGYDHWNSLPVCGLYFFLISKFPENGMLPATTIFLAYGSMFLVLWLAAERYKVGKWYLFLSSFFILSTYWFYDICSGVRNGLTFTLFCLFAYLELVEKKWKPGCWAGYIAMCLMHSSGILMLLIRIALFVSGKRNTRFMSFAVLFLMIVGGAVAPYIGDITGIEYFSLLSEKAEGTAEAGAFSANTAYLVNISVYVVVVLLFFYCSSILRGREKYKDFSQYKQYVQLMLMFMLGSITYSLAFLRFARWVVPAMASVVFMVGMQANSDKKQEILDSRKNKSIIKSGVSLSSNEIIVNFCFIAYTVIHMWYACNGSSLIWLHFS